MTRAVYVFLALAAGLAFIGDLFLADNQSQSSDASKLPVGWRPTQVTTLLAEGSGKTNNENSSLDKRSAELPKAEPGKTVEDVSMQLGEAEDRIRRLEQDATVQNLRYDSLQRMLDDERSRTRAAQTSLDSSRTQLQQAEAALRSNAETRHWFRLIAWRNVWVARSRYQILASRFARLTKEDGEREKQVSTERLRSLVLEHDLEAARDQLSKGTAQNEDRAERGITDRSTKTALVEGPDHLRAEVRSLAQALELERSKVGLLTMGIALMREQRYHESIARKVSPDLARSGPSSVSSNQATQHVNMSGTQSGDDAGKLRSGDIPASTISYTKTGAVGDKAARDSRLSEGVYAHVVLHFSSTNEASREQAVSLASTLSAQGIDVHSLPSSVAEKSGLHITYYYAEDSHVAENLAAKLAAASPVQADSFIRSAPRPGTINVWVGG
jgi:hypothetical protein